jgi:hypothetical protein
MFGSIKVLILNDFVLLPTSFSALTTKLNVPAVVGVPVIAPVLVLILKPGGSAPLDTDHVIGVEPLAASL